MKTNTDYAINKLSKDAIVYRFADGTEQILTKVDFSSEEEFLKWKVISDDLYHVEELTNKKNERYSVSLEVADFDGNEPGEHDEYFVKDKEMEMEILLSKVYEAFSLCTEKQQKRINAFVNGQTYREIASNENGSFQSVWESVESGLKKIRKITNIYKNIP